MKKKNKGYSDRGLQYYRATLKKKNTASTVIGLEEFVHKFKSINPNIDKIIYNSYYVPNQPHLCNGNSLYLATILLPNEFNYIEGVIEDNERLYHHSFLFSKSLNCYLDPTLEPSELKYFISDIISNMDKLYSLMKYDKEFETYVPTWLNKNIPTSAKIKNKGGKS